MSCMHLKYDKGYRVQGYTNVKTNSLNIKDIKLNQLKDSTLIFDYTPHIYNASYGRTIFFYVSL